LLVLLLGGEGECQLGRVWRQRRSGGKEHARAGSMPAIEVLWWSLVLEPAAAVASHVGRRVVAATPTPAAAALKRTHPYHCPHSVWLTAAHAYSATTSKQPAARL
jgi:hypothetical protein